MAGQLQLAGWLTGHLTNCQLSFVWKAYVKQEQNLKVYSKLDELSALREMDSTSDLIYSQVDIFSDGR